MPDDEQFHWIKCKPDRKPWLPKNHADWDLPWYNLKVKFFADEMLGKLAHWLRMAGVDVAYQNNISDDTLIQTAKTEDRIILTRDTRLIRRLRPQEYFFISHDHLKDQFEELFSRISADNLELHPFSRCSECNDLLEPIDKEAVKGKVWSYVYQTQEHFTRCPGCERIYWPATHLEKITRRLGHLLPNSPM
jgi:uncharacterized protein